MDHYHYYHHQEQQQQQDEWAWNISDTYSMSFCTSNLDLPTWKLLHVPQLGGDLSLRALIGSSVLRFVMYENLTPPDKGTTHHLQQYLRYAYVVQVRFSIVDYYLFWLVLTSVDSLFSKFTLCSASTWDIQNRHPNFIITAPTQVVKTTLTPLSTGSR